MKKVRTRIAPSPTGSPHIGTAYAALFNFVFAKKNQGDFVLRIEDTDRTRLVPGSEKEIHEALTWLGLETDEGPDQGGKYGPYRQSERLELYQEYVEKLVKEGSAYYCDCGPERLAKVREEQQAKKEVPRYDRKCRFDPPKDTDKAVIRLAVPIDGETEVEDLIRGRIVFENKNIDDQVLLKSDGFPTYHLASVVDDHLMEISHVIRAEEWLSSTPKHVLLYQAFGWELPKFAHLPLLRNQDKSKISKRKNPVAVDFYRKQGYLSEALVNFLALMGWSMPNDQEIFTLDEMIENFTFERIGTVGPVFDIQKLSWLNGEYIRQTKDVDLIKRLKEFSSHSEKQIKDTLPLVKERMKRLAEFDSLVDYFFEDPEKIDEDLLMQKGKNKAETAEVLNAIAQTLENIDWSKNKIETAIKKKQETLGWNNSSLFMTIRVAVSGGVATPPLFDTLESIGKDSTLRRLKSAAANLS